MKNEKLIIFDMDGTLIDSGDVITNTINHVREYFKLKKIPKKILLENLNNPDINSSEFFYNTKEFTSLQTEVFENYYNKHCHIDISLYDGIYDLLEELKSKNYILSVATNASSPFAIKMLKAMDIYKFFSLVVGANDVKNPKPAPDMLLYTLEKLDFRTTQAVLIGDSFKDTRSAKAIDMKSFLVNWGFSTYENEITDIKQLKKGLNL
jgi:phosphoglycolate phosphatase